MTDTETAQVQQIRAREQQATPGPWRVDALQIGALWNIGTEDVDIALAAQQPQDQRAERRTANAEFIANARQDIPFLLDLLARQQAEIDSLKAESVQALARHYGCGEHVSFSDAWRWLAERVEISRLVQAKVETHKSKAGTALEAVDDRLTALQAEIDRLRGERDELQEAYDVELANGMPPTIAAALLVEMKKTAEREHARAESAASSLSALREALKTLYETWRGDGVRQMNEAIAQDKECAALVASQKIKCSDDLLPLLLASPTPEDHIRTVYTSADLARACEQAGPGEAIAPMPGVYLKPEDR